ncbi:uncharacterized protein Z518_05797 [Rhinocladiella mackenziei CBS 650.93]|uniref:Phosphatidic acid phosphatase type 2/haloperoxidase domain-containing protein n=1 Tax=Rhinocladiella mackenziei CBS 650.93 TaxID=1442369 RepID=A0A0D2IP50_9EURO|nr:uncharacterized protein Z518_05797 [Rhinocladiella mackenziei CBS 650.93]KIX04926.1 hypothetical protein Z518_05797 [Rhinocladiella mackenziei CBS 650.93]
MVDAGKTHTSLAAGAQHLSKRLVASYVIDWILILGIAAIGIGFSNIDGSRRRFSLQDPHISYAYHDDTISNAVLFVVSLIAPAVITAVLCLILEPGPTVDRASTPREPLWRQKIWEWNTAWMGLGLTLASTYAISEGLKDLAGKPRPYLLDVCDPDLSPASIVRHRVGGLGTSVDSAVPIVVDWHICRSTDEDKLSNAFASWPSGHSSYSWAGMLYLTLFVCAKLAIHIPFLQPTYPDRGRTGTYLFADKGKEKYRPRTSSSQRNEAAAPPIYLLILAFVPMGTALFISVSRYFDYHHDGFDIISGALIGICMAWFGFRWYHLPIRGSAGSAWGARSRNHAFWPGCGRISYVGDEGWETERTIVPREDDDVEAARYINEQPSMSGAQSEETIADAIGAQSERGRPAYTA